MAFNHIQTFYIDPASAGNATEVMVTSIDLYFKRKPNETNNSSGIVAPGVVIQICDATQEAPTPNKYYAASTVRQTFQNIFPLADATIPTNFRFPTPLSLKTGYFYGLMIQFEDPGFEIWIAKQGDALVGTNTAAQGPAGAFAGSLFDSTNAGTFKAKNDTDLKFRVNVARYTANTTTLTFVPDAYEFISITDRSANAFQSGELVFQDAGSANVTFYKSGTLTVNATSNTINGNGTTFTSTVGANSYVVLTDGTSGNTDVRRVLYVANNTQMVLEERPSFSNTVGRYKVPPVGRLFDANYADNEIILNKSTANTTVRFSNNGIGNAAITAGGTGYSNADVVTFSGGGSSVNAVANLTTNSTGGIIALNLTNTGLGFTTDATVGITTSGGSGATIVANTTHIGLRLVGAISKSTANLFAVGTKDISQIVPRFAISLPAYASMNVTHNFSANDSGTWKVQAINVSNTKLGEVNDVSNYRGYLLSRSIEVTNTSFLYNSSYSGVVNAAISVSKPNTALFESPILAAKGLDIFMFRNVINNSANNENTNYGNALSKHITTKVAFANNRFAEDIRVTLTAYKPANTDVLVYARLHNSSDPDAFDDKQWTQLQLKDGIGLLSSKTDSNNFIELGYGLPLYPPSSNTLAGVVSTVADSNTITGVGTAFNTDLVVDDLVKIYSPIQPQNYQIAVVSAVTNATSINIQSPVVNNSVTENIVGNGFSIDKLDLKFTAFNNILNDNVARYYNSSMVEYDSFDSMQVKVVLLAANSNLVPRLEDLRAIGVSA